MTVSDPVHDQSTETWYAIGDVAQATPLRTITTLSNAAGDRVSIKDMAATSQSVWSAAYDDLGRMTTSSQSFYVGGVTGGVTSPTQNFTYGYTSNGDRNVMTLGLNGPGGTISASSGFDNLNRTTRLTQTVDGRTLQVGIGYLADGRLDTITRSRGVDAGSLATVRMEKWLSPICLTSGMKAVFFFHVSRRAASIRASRLKLLVSTTT